MIDEPQASEFPKWVEVHPSHVATDGLGNQVVHGFEAAWDRVSQKFSALVADADEEAKATSEKPAPPSKSLRLSLKKKRFDP